MTELTEVKISKPRKTPERSSLNELGKIFATARIKKELTTAQWAELLGISVMQLNNLERHTKVLTPELMHRAMVNLPVDEQVPFLRYVANTHKVLPIPFAISDEQIIQIYNLISNPSLDTKPVVRPE